jgi:uncharacterized membrane protein YdjX (TVP38/TMEM64 family)
MSEAPTIPEPAARGRALPRIVAAVALLLLLAAVIIAARTTPAGRHLLSNWDHPRQLAADVRRVTASRLVLAAVVYVGLYLLLSVLLLPIWWLQPVSGIVFGLYYGFALSLFASSIGAVLTAAISRWIAADFFHRRVESRLGDLRKLDQILGHNGLLVVMSSRLTHFVPFGLSNYAFGLLEMSLPDIFIGTILGGVPATAFYVALGVMHNPLRNWKFDLIVGTVNVLLLVPLALRYTKPEWFKKWGLE